MPHPEKSSNTAATIVVDVRPLAMQLQQQQQQQQRQQQQQQQQQQSGIHNNNSGSTNAFSSSSSSSTSPKKRNWLSVTCVSVTLAVLLISIAAAVSLIVSLSYALSAADDFARTYSVNLVTAAREKVDDFVKIPMNAHSEIYAGCEMGLWPNFIDIETRMNDTDPTLPQRHRAYQQWFDFYRPMMFSSEFTLVNIAVGFVDMSLLTCTVEDAASLKYYCMFLNYQNKTHLALTGGRAGYQLIIPYDKVSPNPVGPNIIGESTFNPYERQWFIDAPKERGAEPVFSKLYLDYQIRKSVIDVTGPLYHADGTFLGVSTISLDLREVSDFLSRIPRTTNSLMILIDSEGYMGGASDLGDLFDTTAYDDAAAPPLAAGCEAVGDGTKICRHRPSTYNHGALREVALKAPEMFFINAESFTRDVSISGANGGGGGKSRWMVSKAPISAVTRSLKNVSIGWQIITLMPVSDVTGQINEGRDVAIIIAVVMIVVSCVICAIALFFLLRPLSVLSELMESASQLRDDTLGAALGDTKSYFREIRTIQDAFEQLSAQLKRAKSFLPAAMLAQLEGECSDDDDDYDGHKTYYNDDDDDDEGEAVLNSASASVLMGTTMSDRHGRRYGGGKGGGADEDDMIASTASGRAVALFAATGGGRGGLRYSPSNGGISPQTSSLKMKQRQNCDAAGGVPDSGTDDGHGSSSTANHNQQNRRGRGGGEAVAANSTVTGTSNRTSHHSGGSGSSGANGGVGRIISSQVSLAQKTVTVVSLNIRRFHAMAQSALINSSSSSSTSNHMHTHNKSSSFSLSHFETSYGLLVDYLQTVAKDHKGLLESFHGDRFVLTFNAVRPCNAHASMAATAALRIVSKLSSADQHSSNGGGGGAARRGASNNNQQRRPSLSSSSLFQQQHQHQQHHQNNGNYVSPSSSDLTIGIATGRCLVGNLGSDRAKRFTIIGAAYSQSFILERLCKRYPQTVSVLMSAETAYECETSGSVGFLFLDYVLMPSSSMSSSSSSSSVMPSGGAAPPPHHTAINDNHRHHHDHHHQKPMLIAAAKYIKNDRNHNNLRHQQQNHYQQRCRQQQQQLPPRSPTAATPSHADDPMGRLFAALAPATTATVAAGGGVGRTATTNTHSSNIFVAADDEWMYELQHFDRSCNYSKANQSFKCCLKGDVVGAREQLAQFIDVSLEGEVARSRLHIMIESLSSPSTVADGAGIVDGATRNNTTTTDGSGGVSPTAATVGVSTVGVSVPGTSSVFATTPPTVAAAATAANRPPPLLQPAAVQPTDLGDFYTNCILSSS